MKKRRLNHVFMALSLLAVICSCSHKTTDRLVGNDRDKHGCIASAGYVWSEARRDCIRIWEVGERLENGDRKVFVVFGNDSLMAEIYHEDGSCIRCRRKGDVWKKGKHTVYVNNGVTTAVSDGVRYTVSR